MDSIGKTTRQFEIRRRSFAPYQIGIRGIRQTAADRLLNARMGAVKTFAGAFAGNKTAVIGIAVGGDQICRIRIGTRNHQRRDAHHISGQTRSNQFLNRLLRGDQHLAAHMAAFLHRRQLIFEVNGRCTGFNHRFHQFEGIQNAAKTGFRISNDRQEVIHIARIVGFNTGCPLDLIRTTESVVDPIHYRRNRVCRVQRLIRIHAGCQVGICRHLPA